jgi:hypothetical protein
MGCYVFNMKRPILGWGVVVALFIGVFFVTYITDPVARRASYWGDDWRDKPVVERVGVLPADAAASLRGALSRGNFASELAPAQDAEYMVEDLQEALVSLPEAVRLLVERRLIGVFLVEGLGNSESAEALGMAYRVGNFWRGYHGTVILVDRDDTDRRANEAMAGMEYVPSGEFLGFAVEPKLVEASENDRVSTLRYVLSHELGHLVDMDREIVPTNFSYGGPADDCGFACLSWHRPRRHRFSQKLVAAMESVNAGRYEEYVRKLPDTFDQLQKTNFPSLYATTKPGEDFAESFAMYVHTVLMEQPWDLTLRENGTIVAELGSCFVDDRCPRKRSYMNALFASVSQ